MHEDKIQATISGKQLIVKHKLVLVEGKCYIIQNFHVGKNDGKFLPTSHNFRINFNWSTNIRECDANIPEYGCHFVFFDDILEKS